MLSRLSLGAHPKLDSQITMTQRTCPKLAKTAEHKLLMNSKALEQFRAGTSPGHCAGLKCLQVRNSDVRGWYRGHIIIKACNVPRVTASLCLHNLQCFDNSSGAGTA